MREYLKIYLAGGMSKFGKEDFKSADQWRVYCKAALENSIKPIRVSVINPNDYFNFKEEPPRYSSEREVMEFDLNKIRNTDLLIINFNDKYSLGTMAELAIAYERKIPVIGLNETGQKLHPWQYEMTNRVFDDMDEMLEYVEDFYLT